MDALVSIEVMEHSKWLIRKIYDGRVVLGYCIYTREYYRCEYVEYIPQNREFLITKESSYFGYNVVARLLLDNVEERIAKHLTDWFENVNSFDEFRGLFYAVLKQTPEYNMRFK